VSGSVLIADGSKVRARRIREACSTRGFATTLVPNGAAALEAALAELTARFGSDIGAWRWGAAHVVRLDHPILSRLPLVGGLFGAERGEALLCRVAVDTVDPALVGRELDDAKDRPVGRRMKRDLPFDRVARIVEIRRRGIRHPEIGDDHPGPPLRLKHVWRRAVHDHDVLAILPFDKSESFVIIEPLNGSRNTLF